MFENSLVGAKMNIKESKKKYRETHRESLRIYQRNYRATHKEEQRKYMQKYRARKKAEAIIQKAMEASPTFDLLDSFLFNHIEWPPNQSNAIDAIEFGLSQGMSDTTKPPTLVKELASNRSVPLPDSSTGGMPETFDWFEDIFGNSSNRSVLISEIKDVQV